MNYVEHRFSLDVHETVSQVSVRIKKRNTAHRLLIHLTERGCPFHISPECYAVFTARKPDGKAIFNGCSIEDCVIIYDLTPQTVAAAGLLECEIMLYGADNALCTSASFNIIVEDTVYDEDMEIESEAEATALTQLISEATTLIDDVETKLEKGEFVGPQGPQGEQGEVDPEEIGRIVDEYLEKNPPAAYTLPIATETTLGGVKAAAATEEMTQPVGITAEGKLVTVPGQNSGGNANQGGISTRAANLLITILQNVTLYDTNQLENISALQTELLSGAGSGGEDNPDTVMYTVTNNLSKVSNSNPMTSIEENSAYSAVLTASDGYTLDGAIVTVTMNGVDITATAYTEGVVTIEAVTGNVVISASAVLDGVIYTLPAPVSNETGTTGTSYIVDTGINISDPTESKTITFSFTPNENCAASAGNFSVMLCSSGKGVVGAQNAVCCIVSFDGKNVQFRIRDSSGSNTTTDLLTGGALGDTWKCVWMYDASVKEYTYKVISVNTAGAATNVVTKTVDVSTWELEENAGTMIVGGWQKDNGAYAMTNTTVHDVTIYNGLLDDDAVAGYLAA